MRTKKKRTKLSEEEISAWKSSLLKSTAWFQVPLALVVRYNDAIIAVIWSAIHNYGKMDRQHLCRVSHARLGVLSGCNADTTGKRIKLLVKDGYVELVRDNRIDGRPNWYRVTNKQGLARDASKAPIIYDPDAYRDVVPLRQLGEDTEPKKSSRGRRA